MIIKNSFNSRKKFIKNISCGNYDSKGKSKIIFKIQERLFSPNTLSLLSKNNHKISRNYINLLKNPTPSSNKEKAKIKKYRFKSYDNDKNYKNIYPQTQSKTQKISFSTAEEAKPKKQPRQSYLNLQDINKIKKRDTQIILPNVGNISFPGTEEPEIPRKFMQINRILKFHIVKKKEEIEKDLTPMKLGNDYVDFIEKKNKIFFNPNFNSPFIHKMNSNYMVDKNFLKKLKTGFSTTKLKIKVKEKLEKNEDIELELRDKMEEPSIDLENYKKAIKIFLTDETKLNQIYIHEEFFDSFENKINYLFDDRKYPTIKNNLNRIKVEIKTSGGYEWNRINMIEISTLTYLHKLKAKIQRELDEIDEEEENKEKQFKINQQIGKYDYKNIKKRKKRKKSNKSQETEKTEESKSLMTDNKNIYKIKEKDFEEEEESEEEKIEDKEDLYELEEFFFHKGNPYKRIDFAKGKSAYAVYNNPKFYREYYIINKADKEDKNIIKKKKEFDLYL